MIPIKTRLILFFFSFLCLGLFSENIDFKIISGENFDIIFQSECLESITPLVERAGEIYERLSEFYGIKLDKFKIYVLDTIDTANAYADPFSNAIIIYLNRNDAGDFSNKHEFWLPFVFSHELTHMLVSNKKSFFKNIFDPFGSAISVGIDSAFTPSWYQEGAAILSESMLFESGRNSDIKFNSYIKSDIATRDFYGLKFGGSNYSPVFQPSGMNYLYGSSFMKYVYDEYGKDKYVSFVADFGADYSYNLRTVSRKLLDQEWLDLMQKWKKHETEKIGSVNYFSDGFEKITDSGYYSGLNCVGGGFIYYSDFSEGVFKLVRENTDGEKSFWVLPFTRKFDFNSDDDIVTLLSTGDGVEKYDTEIYTGKWKGQLKRLKTDLRPIQVKWFGQGKLLVTSYEKGGSSLLIYDMENNTYEKLLSGNEYFFINDMDVYRENILLSITMNCETSLFFFEIETGELKKLFSGFGNCFNPRACSDRILFCSDREGEYAVYEYEPDSKTVKKILSVPFNCAHAINFNGFIYFQNYSGNGFNLYRIKMESAAVREAEMNDVYTALRTNETETLPVRNVYTIPEFENYSLKPEIRILAPFVFPWDNRLCGFAGIGGWDDLKNIFWYAYYYNLGFGENFEISLINRLKYPVAIAFNGSESGANLKGEFEFPINLRENGKNLNITPKLTAELKNLENIRGFENIDLNMELRSTVGSIYNLYNDFSVPEFFTIFSFGNDMAFKGGVGFAAPFYANGIAYLQASSKNLYAALAGEVWIPVEILKPFGTSDGFFSFNGLTCHLTSKIKNTGFPIAVSLGLALKNTANYWLNSVVNIDLIFDYPSVYPVFTITGVGI